MINKSIRKTLPTPESVFLYANLYNYFVMLRNVVVTSLLLIDTISDDLPKRKAL